MIGSCVKPIVVAKNVLVANNLIPLAAMWYGRQVKANTPLLRATIPQNEEDSR